MGISLLNLVEISMFKGADRDATGMYSYKNKYLCNVISSKIV